MCVGTGGKCGTVTKSLPGNRYLHERVGRGAADGAVVGLAPGLDLSTGETGALVGAEGRLARRSAWPWARKKPLS